MAEGCPNSTQRHLSYQHSGKIPIQIYHPPIPYSHRSFLRRVGRRNTHAFNFCLYYTNFFKVCERKKVGIFWTTTHMSHTSLKNVTSANASIWRTPPFFPPPFNHFHKHYAWESLHFVIKIKMCFQRDCLLFASIVEEFRNPLATIFFSFSILLFQTNVNFSQTNALVNYITLWRYYNKSKKRAQQ